jgi:hypothetical protein
MSKKYFGLIFPIGLLLIGTLLLGIFLPELLEMEKEKIIESDLCGTLNKTKVDTDKVFSYSSFWVPLFCMIGFLCVATFLRFIFLGIINSIELILKG